MFVEGTTIFRSYLTEHETYQEQSTGKFAVQITLDPKVAAELAKDGMKIKEYEGEPLRKFTSRYAVPVYTADKQIWNKEIPSGSKVKLEYTIRPHQTAGNVPYVKRILIRELGEETFGATDDEFFEDQTPF
jgi:hypothetical protein